MCSQFIIQSGLFWAVPVCPAELGKHLEAYDTVRPALMTLRLCHRFGRGFEVYITKIPVELVEKIEDIMFESALAAIPYANWAEPFHHFEGRCAPMDHVDQEDKLKKTFAKVKAKVKGKLCGDCIKESETVCSAQCVHGCYQLVEKAVNNLIAASGVTWHERCCLKHHDPWTRSINQSQAGGFAKYDKVLTVSPKAKTDVH